MAAVAIDVQARCDALRAILKEWERAYLASFGHKPAKKDIAADIDIESKYKEYEKLRAKLSRSKAPSKPPSDDRNVNPQKRKAAEDLAPTSPPKRAAGAFATPRKPKSKPTEQVGEEETQVENTPQSERIIMVGPTPQKDGIPMGIFDNIPQSLLFATPSAKRIALLDLDGNIIRTPSRLVQNTPESIRAKFSKTPMSEGKRFMLDQFATPKSRKQEMQQRTPSSLEKQFQTPAFLKRYAPPMTAIEEEESPRFNKTMPWKKPKFGRSLSSMIQEHRRQEDEKADAELDILRELEQGDETQEPRPKPKAVQFEDVTSTKVTEKPIGLDKDGFIPSDVEAELHEINAAEAAAAEKAGQPLKTYKKKGLKRQTKRVNMRPVRRRPQKPAENIEPDFGSDEEEAERTGVVPETQKDDLYDDLNDNNTDEENDNYEPNIAEGTAKSIEEAKSPVKGKNESQSKDGKKKKIVDRGNYRRLNIKNKNSKANGRRFGRRR